MNNDEYGSVMKLKDKVSIVTGGGSGIGRGIATRFAKEGSRVCVAGRTEESLKKTVSQIRNEGGECIYCITDVRISKDVENLIDYTLEKFGKIDIVCNNAAATGRGKVTEISEEFWDEVIDTNLKGTFLVSKFALPHMIENGSGVILNIGSASGVNGAPNRAAYSSSKAGIILLTKSMAIDYGPSNIRTNCLAPGPTITDLFLKNTPKEEIGTAASFIPSGKISSIEDVANSAVFLVSSDAANINGATLVLDGGATARWTTRTR